MGGAESKNEAAAKEIRTDLECPVCSDDMRPPIKQCSKGHNICHVCNDIVIECPHCESPMTQVRNYTLERIFERLAYYCDYKEKGCKYLTVSNNMQEHLKDCRYRPISCPFIASLNCKMVTSLEELSKHCEECHPTFYVANSPDKNTFSMHFDKFDKIKVDTVVEHILDLDGNIYLCKVSVEFAENTVKFGMFCLEGADMSKKYHHILEIANMGPFKHLKKTVSPSLCYSFFRDPTNKFSFSQAYEMLKDYCSNNTLFYRVSMEKIEYRNEEVDSLDREMSNAIRNNTV